MRVYGIAGGEVRLSSQQLLLYKAVFGALQSRRSGQAGSWRSCRVQFDLLSVIPWCIDVGDIACSGGNSLLVAEQR